MAYHFRMVVALMLLTTTLTAQIHRRPVSLPDTAKIQLGCLMQFPVDGTQVSGHHYRNGRFHHGLDIADNNRDTVRSAWLGRVRYARRGYNGGYGNLVIITHINGLETYYAHLRDVFVNEGQWIGQGIAIGIVGSTGNSRGAHLHFEVRYNGLSLDPTDVRDVLVINIARHGQIYIVK